MDQKRITAIYKNLKDKTNKELLELWKGSLTEEGWEALKLILAERGIDPNTERCPYCAEVIEAEAIVCRYCGREFEDSQKQLLALRRLHKLHKELNKARAESNSWGVPLGIGFLSGLLGFLFAIFTTFIVASAINFSLPSDSNIPIWVGCFAFVGVWILTTSFLRRSMKHSLPEAETTLRAATEEISQQLPSLTEKTGGKEALLDAARVATALSDIAGKTIGHRRSKKDFIFTSSLLGAVLGLAIFLGLRGMSLFIVYLIGYMLLGGLGRWKGKEWIYGIFVTAGSAAVVNFLLLRLF